MALHVNLFYEQHQAARARQRDPVKIGVLLMVLIAAGLGGYYFLQNQGLTSLRAENRTLQSDWSRLQPQQEEADANRELFQQVIDATANLTGLIEDRILWAPILETLLTAVPANVQLVRMRGSVDDTNQRINLSLEGLSAGSEPREVAEALRQRLIQRFNQEYSQATASFRSLDDSGGEVQVDDQIYSSSRFHIDVFFEIAVPESTTPDENPDAT